MATRPIEGYVLFVDGKDKRVSESLEDLQKAALEIGLGKPLRIESYVAPSRSRIWIYDFEFSLWVEQV